MMVKELIAELSKFDPESEAILMDDEFKWWKIVGVEECFWNEAERKAFSIDDEDVDPSYVKAVNVLWDV